MSNTFSISGQIVDLKASRIFSGTVQVKNGKIDAIIEEKNDKKQFILPGFIDAHVHIESSMVVPSEFARMAVCHGTVATVSDPHEIANVLGIDGVTFMIDNGKQVPFKFYFGAPSCVPATCFETSGFTLDAKAVDTLMSMDDIYYLAEMMNCPGVIGDNAEILQKIASAKRHGKPIDGHAPAVSGEGLKKYVAAGISTDHECFTLVEAEEKIELGMIILIREESAAKNFEALASLLKTHPDKIMFCSDDKHPNELAKGHINVLVKRSIDLGYNVFDVLKAASLNAVEHYGLNVGLLHKGDDADFIVVDNLHDFNIKQTFIKGISVAENGTSKIEHCSCKTPNNFIGQSFSTTDFEIKAQNGNIKVIDCIDGQLITKIMICPPKTENGFCVSDTERDILKIAVINRYSRCKPALGFIHNFGLKRGAIASSIAHDSHNIVVVGTSDVDICKAVNLIIGSRGGVVAFSENESAFLPMPVAGLMSNADGYEVAEGYEKVDDLAKKFGTRLQAPFMTLAFMSLLVIPELKLSDKGLFNGNSFSFTPLFV